MVVVVVENRPIISLSPSRTSVLKRVILLRRPRNLPHEALPNDLQRPALLQDLSAHVEGQVLCESGRPAARTARTET
eukprot:2689570-Pyramimonas_sp.AAC.1